MTDYVNKDYVQEQYVTDYIVKNHDDWHHMTTGDYVKDNAKE